MLTDLHDFYHAFMEGLMGTNKAWKFMRKAEIWRFADAERLGRMYRKAVEVWDTNARFQAIQLREAHKSIECWMNKAQRLEEENARLREALENILATYDNQTHDMTRCPCYGCIARAALEVKP